jgi:hypothetical protein
MSTGASSEGLLRSGKYYLQDEPTSGTAKRFLHYGCGTNDAMGYTIIIASEYEPKFDDVERSCLCVGGLWGISNGCLEYDHNGANHILDKNSFRLNFNSNWHTFLDETLNIEQNPL